LVERFSASGRTSGRGYPYEGSLYENKRRLGKALKSFVFSEEPLVPLLSLALVTLAGLALWLFFATRQPGDDSAEAGFARDMMVHHAQAVEMAEIAQGKTESEDIATLAPDIALTQQGQIGQMQGWLQVWGLSPTGSEPAMSWMGEPTNALMPGMATPEEIQQLRDASPEEANVLFLQLMIPHHQAALQMTEAIRGRSDRPEVETLAKAISASQQSEIQNMEQMLQDRGASLPEEPEMNMENM
jgi:uncharacterized protein (DUF305 family)